MAPSNDIALDELDKQIKFISKTGLLTKRPIIQDQLDVSKYLNSSKFYKNSMKKSLVYLFRIFYLQ